LGFYSLFFFKIDKRLFRRRLRFFPYFAKRYNPKIKGEDVVKDAKDRLVYAFLRQKLIFFLFIFLKKFNTKKLNICLSLISKSFCYSEHNIARGSLKLFFLFLLFFKKILKFFAEKQGYKVSLGFFKFFCSYYYDLFAIFLIFPGYKYVVYKEFLNLVLNILVKKLNLTLDFFLISNITINATFLARYICKKISQNFGIKALMNPLIKEFGVVAKEIKASARSEVFLKIMEPPFLKEFKSSFLTSFLVDGFSFYKKFYLKFFILNSG
jgi:hypothetical protein